MKLPTEHQRRMLLSLTDEWQTASELAEVAGIPTKGAGTVLLALRTKDSLSAATAATTGTSGDADRATPGASRRD